MVGGRGGPGWEHEAPADGAGVYTKRRDEEVSKPWARSRRLEDWRLAGYHVQRGRAGSSQPYSGYFVPGYLGRCFAGPTAARGLRGGGSKWNKTYTRLGRRWCQDEGALRGCPGPWKQEGRSVVKYASLQLRRVQSTRGVRLRRWRPHSRKVPWKWSWRAIKPSLELTERGSALPSAFQSPPRTGPRSLSRRDDLPGVPYATGPAALIGKRHGVLSDGE